MPDNPQRKAWVLTSEYSDHSAYTVVRTYLDKDRADADHALVKDDHCLEWKLHEVPLFGEEGTF